MPKKCNNQSNQSITTISEPEHINSSPTGPIDISYFDASHKRCTQNTCVYSPNYHMSECSVSKYNDYLEIQYDNSGMIPVNYDGIDYYLNSIRIYTKSLHSFNGSKTAAEVVLVHTNPTGLKDLLVCVPVVKGNEKPTAPIGSKFLNNTIKKTAKSSKRNVTIPGNSFTAQIFITNGPFVAYTGTSPFSVDVVNYIVFIHQTSTPAFVLDYDTMSTLINMISKNTYKIYSNNTTYINKIGPIVQNDTTELYMDCQAVNSADEVIVTDKTNKDGSLIGDVNVKLDMKNPYVQIILYALLFGLPIIGLNYAIRRKK